VSEEYSELKRLAKRFGIALPKQRMKLQVKLAPREVRRIEAWLTRRGPVVVVKNPSAQPRKRGCFLYDVMHYARMKDSTKLVPPR
jgi:hypothetical protein